MEIADIFVVNKADREGADRTVASIEAMLSLRAVRPTGDWRPPVVQDRGDDRRRASPELVADDRAVPRAHGRDARRRAAARAPSGGCASSSAQRFMQHVERDVLAPGEFERLLDRIAEPRDRSVHGGRRRSWRGAGRRRRRADRRPTPSSITSASRSRRRRSRSRSIATLLGLETDAPEDVGVAAGARSSTPAAPTLELRRSRRRRTRRSRSSSRSAAPALHHLCCRVDDIDAALAQLKAQRRAADRRGAAAGRARLADRVHSSVERQRRAGRAEAGRDRVRAPVRC